MKVLSRGPVADAVPLLSILTACDCSVEELERIAAFLETQTLKRWRWIHCPGVDSDCLPVEGMAVLYLPRAPAALRATALEEAIWFLLSRPTLPWVELREDARRGDLFVSRRSLPEGRIGARLNGRRQPCSSAMLAPGACLRPRESACCCWRPGLSQAERIVAIWICFEPWPGRAGC